MLSWMSFTLKLWHCLAELYNSNNYAIIYLRSAFIKSNIYKPRYYSRLMTIHTEKIEIQYRKVMIFRVIELTRHFIHLNHLKMK